jgi:hypothetical protein
MGNFEDFGLKISGWKFLIRGNKHAKLQENQKYIDAKKL